MPQPLKSNRHHSCLPGKPEFAAADPATSRVYFGNIEDKTKSFPSTPQSHAVANTWPIAPGQEASGMAIDAVHQRLFIGCHNKLMEMIDCGSGKVVGIGSNQVPGVDANAFDPVTGLAFASCGDGVTTIAQSRTVRTKSRSRNR